jgi:hypothetical protein
MIGLLLALYPAGWRRRYGEEFRAVLESRPLGPFDVADVVLGALDARLALRTSKTSSVIGGHLTMLRIGGFGAIAGGAFWAGGLAAASAFTDDHIWLVLVLLGTIGILLALAGLSAFQAYRAPRLAWAAFLIPAIGTLVSLVGLTAMILLGDEPLLGTVSGWNYWFIGFLAMLVGSMVFAVATIQAAVLSERAAIALAISSFAVIVLMLGLTGGADTTAARLLSAAGITAFGGSWVALGVTALRRGPIRAIAPA